jgi:hypothetical protein
MADHTLTIHLGAYTTRKLRQAAETAGVSPEHMAEMLLRSAMVDSDVPGGTEASPSAGVSEPATAWRAAERPVGDATEPGDYDGPHVDLEEALDAFDAKLNRRLASRPG